MKTWQKQPKVTRYISWSDAREMREVIGGFGGWVGCHPHDLDGGHACECEDRDSNPFSHRHTWADYIENVAARERPYYEALREDVLARNLRVGGDMHQESWVPVFSDGTVGKFSYRGWGDFMAAVWSEADGRQYSYVSFYMGEGPSPEARQGGGNA